MIHNYQNDDYLILLVWCGRIEPFQIIGYRGPINFIVDAINQIDIEQGDPKHIVMDVLLGCAHQR